MRLVIVLAGIFLGQAILYGPSLIGQKILLPLDILAWPSVYMPPVPGAEKIVLHDNALSDLVFQFETERRFTASELHAGRFPMWTTYQYAGSPLVWPKFSPFVLLSCLVLSPYILPWIQLVEAIVAGFGFYLFCRRALGVGFWAAAIPAWCYPMSGFFVFWQGFPTCAAAYWFPWLLLAVDQTVRRTSPKAWLGLSVVTCLVLISGHIDVAGQCLLGSGIYGLWRVWDTYGGRWFREARIVLVSLTVGWFLGFLLATPHLFPLLEYAQTGARMEHRKSGEEERPPVGLAELPQTVLPDMYGVTREGLLRPLPGNQIESSAAIYVGLFATLLVAPLSWCSRRRRGTNIFFTALILFSVGWCLNLPGIVDLLRLPGLRMMSHNRLVFVGSLGILAMTSMGLDALWRGEVSRRRWFLLPAAILIILGGWCILREIYLPAMVAESQDWNVKNWFIRSYCISAFLCGLALGGWVLLSTGSGSRPWFVPTLAVMLMGDLLWFGHDRSAQSNPAYYYPSIPVFEEVAKSTNSRFVGYNCFPATLAQRFGLRDIRGYDSVDPGRLIDLMDLAIDPHFRAQMPPYAVTQLFVPQMEVVGDYVKLPPLLDMLSVRYVFVMGTANAEAHPAFQGDGYVVLENRAALPRAYVPRRVEMVADRHERLDKLGSMQFDAREVAYVEEPVSLAGESRGEAQITSEMPTRVEVSIKMETPGLLVLSDLWDKGWHAYLNGNRVPILRANHAVRGVVVPAGDGRVEFRYESGSLALGIKLAIAAAIILIGSLIFIVMRERKVQDAATNDAEGEEILTERTT